MELHDTVFRNAEGEKKVLERESVKYDVDVLLLCGKDAEASAIAARTEELVASGRSVSVQRAIPERLRYRELIEL